MLRLIAKLTGLLFLVFAVIAVVLDLTRSIANSKLTITPLGADWNFYHSESLQQFQPAVERHIHPYLWDPVILNILLMPTWLVFFVLAMVFMWLGRKRKKHWQERFGS